MGRIFLRKGLLPIFLFSSGCLVTSFAMTRLVTHLASYSELPGWQTAKLAPSLAAFRKSCRVILSKPENKIISTHGVRTTARDWRVACQAAIKMPKASNAQAKAYFEKYFTPVRFENSNGATGKFTGYYYQQINGSLYRTKKFNVPIYGMPIKYEAHRYAGREVLAKKTKDGYRFFRYTRQEINQGDIDGFTPIIAWTDSRYSRYLLQIEGPGYIKLNNGKKILLNYAGQTGLKSVLIGNLIGKYGLKQKIAQSKLGMDKWFLKHPKEANKLLEKNPSFVFFKVKKDGNTIGAEGVPITPRYTIAIDPKVVPLGAPVWLNVKNKSKGKEEKAQRLMVAQDTGGAIKGNVRADIFVGSDRRLGRKINGTGEYWVLLPKR